MPRDKQYTPDEIEGHFSLYLDWCECHTKFIASASGKVVEMPAPRVMTLGEFLTRLDISYETWNNYRQTAGYEAYFGTIKRIDQIIERNKASALVNGEGNTSGLIFDLKANHGWVDKQVHDLNHKGEGFRIEVVQNAEKRTEAGPDDGNI